MGLRLAPGRTYRGVITINREEWKLKVKSAGWGDAEVVDVPEYDVNPQPLGACPFEEECQILESPTFFICERKLKERTKRSRNKLMMTHPRAALCFSSHRV